MNPEAGKFYGISMVCRMMGVSRATYYKWTHRKVTVHEQENQDIRDDIFGVKRLMTYINADTHAHVSHGRVLRIMRLAGIRASIPVAKRDRQVEKKEFLFVNKLLHRQHGSRLPPSRS